MFTKEELDSLTRKLWEPDPGEDPYCCTATRHNVISEIRSACGLVELGETDTANPVVELARLLKS